MIGIGSRLREERERMRLTQRAFGEFGGVEANAQGKYESGERAPKADYLAAVAAKGADVLYVLTGRREPIEADRRDPGESQLLAAYRQMPSQARTGLVLLAGGVLELASATAHKGKQPAT
jgi:transcriptional regulator with XRE-family HTH domain